MPAELRDALADSWEVFTEAASAARFPLPRDPDFIASLLRVWACSEFVETACVHDPALLYDLLGEGDLLADYRSGEYAGKLHRQLDGVEDEIMLGNVLRDFRLREMVRIAWRDLAGWAGLDEVLGDLSALADTCVAGALDRLSQWAVQSLGRPGSKLTPSLVVLGMGKLGACELNFSSDIDLIFAYPDGAGRWPKQAGSAEEFYQQLGQRLIQALDAVTDHGFVYRVDMRLRPYGDSGPLVANFDALADYYQLQGREWERYAMIKARPVAGPKRAATRLMKLLQPFVYRRYLDFGAFDSLRNLKEQIAREVERKGMQDNIKLGPGGIREIEFIVQAFQLVRGGRQVLLQQRGVLDVLDALAVLGYLPAHVALQLAEAYVFLRRVENRLQAYADQQVHELPDDDLDRVRLAYAMGFEDWEEFSSQLGDYRQLVQENFEQVFAEPGSRAADDRSGTAAELASVWNNELEAAGAVAVLTSTGYTEADETLRWLCSFREGPVTRFLGDVGRQRLDQLMPMLLGAAASRPQPLLTLKRVGELLEAIAGRTAYLSLLVESPIALTQLVQLCSTSAWVASRLAEYPILLDELLDPRVLYNPLDKAGLQGVLELRLAGIAMDDLEQQMDRLRQFRQAAVLHVAATDIVAEMPVTAVADHLTGIAEVVLDKVLQLAWNHLVERHGEPCYLLRGKQRRAGFGILGYGKVGGRELGYGSDLDLVFLHDSVGNEQHTTGPQVLDNHEFFTRLSQRIIHIMNTFTPAGILYEVDTRLRPDGAAGLLVSSLDAFADYQRRSAWTWESQALVRARLVAGDAAIGRQFERVRSGVLARPRNADKLAKEVVEMRQRMRAELDRSNADHCDLKHGRGGIVDLEFMVQWGALLWTNKHTELLRYTDNLNLLEAFSRAGLMTGEEVAALTAAYCDIRSGINHLALQEESPLVARDEFASQRAVVVAAWDRYLGQDEK
ncbi:MAG: bifunctional [glutamate--ammonia ligase]-adenylyl-L-tyrosine phosphorylase/[glutamate--ammonia-ligase] adenylyltransferase [Thiohalobacterales bacterium]